MRNRVCWTIGLAAALVLAMVGMPGHAFAAPADAQDRIAINENRHAAGRITDGVLTVRLEARVGEWFPDGPGNPGLRVKAFGVEGGPLQIPGPLLRVPQGTRVRAFVTNRLENTLALHGLYSRPSASEQSVAPALIRSGETQEFSFLAGASGTYFYWAATTREAPITQRSPADTQLTGAFVIDPKGDVRPDRVFVIGGWANVEGGAFTGAPGQRLRWVINGLSWPATERLSYKVGDTVRLRVINTSFGVHPMHLHGFYFTVNSRGDEQRDQLFASDASPRQAVTERLAVGRTFALTWTPTRAGNWLFHCHDSAHLDHGGPLDNLVGPPNDGHHHMTSSELEMMSGPVIGIAISGPVGVTARDASVSRRHLRLVARAEEDGTDREPAYGYTLETGDASVAKSPYLPGPTLVLKRGEPVDVTVVNELPEPTAVHWHGIELDSYFDGVPGFAGDMTRTAPSIPPGGTFEALFTPPRSGTFIYHAHMDDRRQQQAGLVGPLLVVDSPSSYDPTHDLVLLVTAPRKAADAARVLVNGSLDPATQEFHVGQHYRLRLINLHTARPSMRMRLLSGTSVLSWRSLAKDGMDLPPDQVVEGNAEIQMGNGETYDFDFVPTNIGDQTFEVRSAAEVLLATMSIRVVN